ncbi:MAG: bifunctional precorrin-2 dehydrogenase/sirohydrochlorin ferrochelatase [Deltaproteobacteria bacterium]|nr:bifunctional precorrin-2 dehydrogenase/sirohydrochlorin ferrochelatase [Deltaproteobacteria bacterium]
MNSYYPLFLNLEQMPVLVIGGGPVAERKVRVLLRYGAKVRLVSPALTKGLECLVEARRIACRRRSFRSSDMDRVRLAFCATDDDRLHRRAVREGKKRGVLLNVVDVPELCDFIVPSVIRRGDLTVAVSTGGASPALAKKIRRELAVRFGPEYGRFLKLLKGIRPQILEAVGDGKRRSRLFRKLADSQALALLRKGRTKEAREEIAVILKKHGVEER